MTWIAVAAFHSWHPGVPAGKVKVIATKDGHTAPGRQRRAFLVDDAEYNRIPWPMKIDPKKHEEVK